MTTITLPTEIEVQSEAEMRRLCHKIATVLKPGDVVAFYGDLGSGKTFAIREICAALGCKEPVTSPTFTLMQQYTTASGWPVYHFDFYRLESPLELYNIGLEEFLNEGGITFIEWAEKVETELPEHRWDIHLELLPENPRARRVRIKRRTA